MRFWGVVAACVIVMGTGALLEIVPVILAKPLPNLASGDHQVEVTVDIESREFRPNTVSVQVGQKTRLILRNLDAELHAFVPLGLLTKTSFHVAGNGAPEFSSDGLQRVLLPSFGQTDIVFVPQQAGVYPFFCDLPGHVMNGSVVVHDSRDQQHVN